MIAEQDKDRARHHMGYLGVQASATFQLGIPAATQTQFTIELAFTKVLASAEARFRDLLDKLDTCERQIEDNMENVEVTSIDEIKINEKAFQAVLTRYRHWQGALANLLGIVPNPFDQRPYLGAGNGGGVNVSVIN